MNYTLSRRENNVLKTRTTRRQRASRLGGREGACAAVPREPGVLVISLSYEVAFPASVPTGSAPTERGVLESLPSSLGGACFAWRREDSVSHPQSQLGPLSAG